MKKTGKAKKIILTVAICILAVLVLLVSAFGIFYASRIRTASSITQITDYDDRLNIYSIDVQYDYSIENIIERGVKDTRSLLDSVVAEALPLLPVSIKAPKYNCSAFAVKTDDGDSLMGRNYDFRLDTSAMLVYCHPSDGYSSVGFAALQNISANIADENIKKKLACLTSPFVCLDGINEKGVSIAVLTVDSAPVAYDTDKPDITTTLAIRLVLDRAATTQEAVDLLNQYDMFASSGRDYHFYISDASGDGRAVEWDCESETRDMTVTPIRTVTNFYAMYLDYVDQYDDGKYGHGKDRYDSIEQVLDNASSLDNTTAWEALKSASQLPEADKLTSNTQWSIVFNNTDKTLEIVLRRHWDDVITYDLTANTVTFDN